MKPLKVAGLNFQSYESVEFDYADLGPTLIAGPTKAGKSTLMDLLCWTLFGVTSKESAADDVRAWFADEPTMGAATVDLGDGRQVTVTRIRGKRSAQNDLHFTVNDGDEIRGKDASDTQKKLDETLGVTGDLFTQAAYIHQFSKSETFFVAKAQYRREIIETIQDLSAPVKFAERCAAEKKTLKAQISAAEIDSAKLSASVDMVRSQIGTLKAQEARHLQTLEARRVQLEANAANYETEKEARLMKLVSQLEELDTMVRPPEEFTARIKSVSEQAKKAEEVIKEVRGLESQVAALKINLGVHDRDIAHLSKLKGTCPTCKGPAENDHSAHALSEAKRKADAARAELEPLTKDIAIKSAAAGQHQQLMQSLLSLNRKQADNARLADQFENLKAQAILIRDEKSSHQVQLEELAAQKNPYVAQLEQAEEKVEILVDALEKKRDAEKSLRERMAAVEWLYDGSFKAKALMLTQAIERLQDRTNEVLEEYFDGALRINLSIEDGDKVEVTIQNEGYDCPFRQLSGGERCMLKLAFNVAYMEAAQDCAGVHVDTVMLDEALNGLDADLKVKAYGLIEHLGQQYGTVLCIEHSDEFKLMFPKTFTVKKEGSKSSVSELST